MNTNNPLKHIPSKSPKLKTDPFINESNLDYKINSSSIQAPKKKGFNKTNIIDIVKKNNHNSSDNFNTSEFNKNSIIKIHTNKNQYNVDKSKII